MAKNLVIVESPAKAKTIKKYLGSDYQVLASFGHVRDLVPKEGAVDTDHEFAMKYQAIDRNKKHVDAIAKAIKSVDNLLLAPDPDREGEAIAWHLCELLESKKLLKDKNVSRVVFNEITKTAIKNAVDNPREISMPLVNAQQARRALDYLVGFNLSPLLWKKVKPGLSAGRVQSPALRLIVEREIDIEQFKSQEYWSIIANLKAENKSFDAKLNIYEGEKVEQFTIVNSKQAKEAEDKLKNAGKDKLLVSKVTKKQRKRNPTPPFITSTLQQEASRKLGFSADRTMRVAQSLYEGVETSEGAIGLITYMRTDSVNMAAEAIAEIRDYISQEYGPENLPDSPRVFKKKSKNAQEAHEAIRPTSVFRSPDAMKSALNSDQFKLYQLIWRRTVACQMIHATLNTVAVDLQCGDSNMFRANGSVIANPGFMSVYMEDKDEGDEKDDDKDEKMLPPMEEGQWIDLKNIVSNQHFTEPPPRYSEASLVKALEEFGIGRPSTYASILSTLRARDYVVMDNKRFVPTDIGRVVNYFLTNYFSKYVDYDFTAQLEDQLDAVSRDEEHMVPLLRSFWDPFITLVKEIEEKVSRKDVTQEEIDENCPECSKPLVKRLGRSGRFIGCTGYPECKYTRGVEDDADAPQVNQVVEDRKCPDCEHDLVYKQGRYGRFIGCSNYPECKHIEPLEKPKDTEVKCPECNEGTILQRKSRRGKIFYSCSRYPKCKYAIWNEPVNEPCPKCKWPILTIKTTKRNGTQKVCPQKECDYIVSVEE